MMQLDMQRYFDGATYEHERDGGRLSAQYAKVFSLMSDGRWRSLAEIARETGCPEASVSARLRDMRKPRFGAHTVNRSYAGDGLFIYQVERRGVA